MTTRQRIIEASEPWFIGIMAAVCVIALIALLVSLCGCCASCVGPEPQGIETSTPAPKCQGLYTEIPVKP